MRKHWRQAVILLALAGLGIALFGAGWHARAVVAKGQCTAYPSHWNGETGLCETDIGKTTRLTWAHWEYQSVDEANWINYYFGDSGHTYLWGECAWKPVFALMGGDFAAGKPIDVDIDGHHQSFPLSTYFGAHGIRLQPLDDPSLADRLAAAKRHITIRVGNWTRSVKPAPELALFVNQCRQIHSTNPTP
jgi:hypothetical protein